MTDLTPYFVDHLETLLEQAKEMKLQEPKNDTTRYWAVVYTDLEKIMAYVNTYIETKKYDFSSVPLEERKKILELLKSSEVK